MDTIKEPERHPADFLSLPFEIVDAIAFELSATKRLGPPSSVIPLLSTCSTVYRHLSTQRNGRLWARIFCDRFDCSAVERRAFQPSDAQYIEQLQTYCAAMRRLRMGNSYFGCLSTDLSEDTGLEDALKTGIIMMLENDGKNERHLVDWALADRLVSRLVRGRVYAESGSAHGWPVENERNACALTLMWLLTSEETLERESPEEREQIMRTIFPFMAIPFRYASAEAPPNVFSLPFPSTVSVPPTSFETAHGPYPNYPPSQRILLEPHYGSRPAVSTPLIAHAAKCLFLARAEITGLATPSHMAANRVAWLARGNMGVAPTAEDIEEFNWAWKVRLPLGSGRDQPGHSQLGCELESLESPSRGYKPVGSFLEDEAPPDRDATVCNPRWAGKAPHSPYSPDGRPKSQQWDTYWWRIRLCSDPFMARTRIPYGPVYEIGSLDGLWSGYYVIPEEDRLQSILGSPDFPQDPLDQSLRTTMHPIFVRLREAHSLRSRPKVNLGTENPTSANLNNAWFAGAPGTTEFRMLESANDCDTETVEIFAAGKKETCVVWKRPASDVDMGLGLGNDAFRGRGGRAEGVTSEPEGTAGQEACDDDHWSGYPHKSSHCEECAARVLMRQQIERERAFASIGLGMASSTIDPDVGDERLDELEPGQPEWEDADGNVYPPISPSIDRSKLASSCCSGVREVYCFGRSDRRHADAWGDYRFYGRVRSWDGLIAILRCPVNQDNQDAGMMLIYGYISGGTTFTGNWKSVGSVHEGLPGWEGPLVMSKRED